MPVHPSTTDKNVELILSTMYSPAIRNHNTSGPTTNTITNDNLVPANSTRFPASSHDDTDEEPDDEEEDDEDDESTMANTTVNAPSEQGNNDEGCVEWVPVHHRKKNRSLCWTHYLCKDAQLETVKCKHCGAIITSDKSKNKSSTSRFRSHLRIKHKIDPNSDYYAGTTLLPPTSTRPVGRPKGSTLVSNTSLNSRVISRPSTSALGSLHVGPARESNIDTKDLISIICASQDLPLSFFDNASVRLLLQRAFNNTTIDPELVKESIIKNSKNIEHMVKRTVLRNCNDLPVEIHITAHNTITREQIKEQLRLKISELSNVMFFSLTQHTWKRSHGSPISTVSLQFYDSIKKKQKQILITVKRLGENNVVSLRREILDIFTRFPGLDQSLLSFTTPRSNFQQLLLNDEHPFFKHRNFHGCIVTMLKTAILPLFGHFDANVGHSSLNTQSHLSDDYRSVDENTQLDNIMSLENIEITNPLFDKIDRFKQELNADPWKLDKFHTLCKELLDNGDLEVITFDTTRYSTAVESLKRFLQLRSVIESMEEHIVNQKFTNIDYQAMDFMLETLKSYDRMVLYFSSNIPNFQYMLFSVLTLEKHLKNKIYLMGSHGVLTRSFSKVVNNITDHKRTMMADDMNIIGLFFVPSVLFERDILELIFNTQSLTEIVEMIVKGIYSLLEKHLRLHVGQSQEVGFMDHSNTSHSDNSFAQLSLGRSALRDLGIVHDNSAVENTEELEALIKEMIREDMYSYLSTATAVIPASYRAFCTQTGFSKVDGHYERDGPNGKIQLNYIEELLDIHFPVCNTFWDEFTKSNAGYFVKTVMKILRSESASSIHSLQAFLRNYKSQVDTDILEDVIRVKVFDEQFSSGRVEFDKDTLPTACQFA